MTSGFTNNMKGRVDWPILLQRIQELLYLSQQDIAGRCGVARQTVSAWLHRRREPGLYARRELTMLAAEAGVLDEFFPASDKPGHEGTIEKTHDRVPPNTLPRGGELAEARQLHLLLQQLSPAAREEVLEFVRFKIFRARD